MKFKLFESKMKFSPASSIEINNDVYERKKKGEKIVTLSLGESFFDLPTFKLKINEEHNHYIETLGLPELRRKLSNYYTKFGAKVSKDNIIITQGAKIGIFESLLALKNIEKTFSTVAFIEPAWVSYINQIKLAGLNPYSIDITKVQKNDFSSLKNVDCLIVNNPNNPTGWHMPENTLFQLIEFCRSRNISLIFDEVYSEFTTGQFLSGGKYISKDTNHNIIVVNSVSKNLGISGWRLGYCITNQKIMRSLEIIHQQLITCASVPLQHLINENFLTIQKITESQIAEIVKKRNKLQEYLETIGFNILKGDATFYLFVTHPSISDSNNIISQALDAGLSFVPGSGYGLRYKNFMRVSVGTESFQKIKIAMDKLLEIILSNR